MSNAEIILASGPGSKDRRAALVAAIVASKPHGNSAEGRYLAAILADAAQRLDVRLSRKASKASKATSEPVAEAEPVAEPARKASKATSKASKASKARKASTAHKVRKASKASKVRDDAGSVPCMVCFRQTALSTATVYTEGHVCEACEAEASE